MKNLYLVRINAASKDFSYMKSIKNIYIIILLLFILGCKKDKDTNSENGLNIIIPTTYHSAHLSWNNELLKSDAFLCSIFIGDSLIHEEENISEFNFNDLPQNTCFNGYISITKLSGNQSWIENFKFTTRTNIEPGDFTIKLTEISGVAAKITWTKSIDPEAEPISYQVLLNDTIVEDSITDQEIQFTNLLPKMHYQLTVIARDPMKKTKKQTYSLTTLPEGSEMSYNSITIQNISREYGIYYPSNPNKEKLPLFIFLHGAGGIVWPGMINSYLCNLAEKENFVLLEPQALLGTTPDGTYIQWNAHNILAWDDVFFINALIDNQIETSNIDIDRIYISGMSNGGYMSFKLAMELQDRIAAVAPISGLIDKTLFSHYNLHKPMPLCYMHGTADKIVKIEGGEWSVGWSQILDYWLKNNNILTEPVITQLPNVNIYDNSTVTKFEYLSKSGNEDILFYQINNGNHSIPGIEMEGNQDINAFDVIWDFFKRNKLTK